MNLQFSLSSQAMTMILAFVNSNRETADISNNLNAELDKPIEDCCGWSCVGAAVVSAVAETAIYGTGALLSKIACPKALLPNKFFATCLKSSSFTILWGMKEFLCCCDSSLKETDELEARKKMAVFFHLKEELDDGALFILENIVTALTEEEMELFFAYDLTVMLYMQMKVVHTYAFGDKKKDLLPAFLQSKTKENIRNLRDQEIDCDELSALTLALSNFSEFQKEYEKEDRLPLLVESMKVSFSENRGLLICKSWKQASQSLLKTLDKKSA